MTAYAIDTQRWFAGEVADDTPGSTPVPPPSHGQAPADGEPWPRWRRYAWRLEQYAGQPEVVVPQRVTRRQGLRALNDAQLLDQVEALINGLADPLRTQVRIDWEEAQDFERTDSTLLLLAQHLGLDDAALDALFVSAAQF